MKLPGLDRSRFRCKAHFVALAGVAMALLASSLPAQTPHGQDNSSPDYVVYYNIFHHVATLKKMADTAQQNGQDRSNLRQLVRQRAGLTEAEGQSLETIALQCESDVAAQDARAKAVIDNFHAQYPPSVVNSSVAPTPPPHLAMMWQERSQIILQARDSLHGALGEEDFAKFDEYLKKHGPAPSFYPPASAPPGKALQQPSAPTPAGQ